MHCHGLQVEFALLICGQKKVLQDDLFLEDGRLIAVHYQHIRE